MAKFHHQFFFGNQNQLQIISSLIFFKVYPLLSKYTQSFPSFDKQDLHFTAFQKFPTFQSYSHSSSGQRVTLVLKLVRIWTITTLGQCEISARNFTPVWSCKLKGFKFPSGFSIGTTIRGHELTDLSKIETYECWPFEKSTFFQIAYISLLYT